MSSKEDVELQGDTHILWLCALLIANLCLSLFLHRDYFLHDMECLVVHGSISLSSYFPYQDLSSVLISSSVKMVNQLLAGVHIASAAEAMAFGDRLNLRTRRLFEIIQHARGYSWYVPLVMSLHFDHTHFSILQMCYCGQKMAQGES